MKCPYCGGKAILRDSVFVYGNKARVDEKLYVCQHFPNCNAYVGVHTGTLNPKGTLANATLRQKRINAHHYFDLIWKNKIMSRKNAYKWMADKFGMNLSQSHVASFGDYHCEELITASLEVLKNNHVHLQAVG